jgi:hypothetical protein
MGMSAVNCGEERAVSDKHFYRRRFYTPELLSTNFY